MVKVFFFFCFETGKRRANATASVSRVLGAANSGGCHHGDQVFSFAPYAPQNYMEDKDLWQFGRVSDMLTHAYSLAAVPPHDAVVGYCSACFSSTLAFWWW